MTATANPASLRERTGSPRRIPWGCAAILAAACAHREARPEEAPAAEVTVIRGEGYEGAIFPAGRVEDSPLLDGVAETFTPTAAEVRECEAGLRRFLERTAADPSTNAWSAGEIRKILPNLGLYRRQYAGVIVEGRRRVLVNAFRKDPEDTSYWLESLLVICDGGFWYWQVQYDPASKRYAEFCSNGYA